MAVHLQIRDLPDEVHQTLRERAAKRGLSRLPPVSLTTSGAEAVRKAREADDAALIDALDRP